MTAKSRVTCFGISTEQKECTTGGADDSRTRFIFCSEISEIVPDLMTSAHTDVLRFSIGTKGRSSEPV